MRHALLALLATVTIASTGCSKTTAPPPQPRYWYSGGTVQNANAKRWTEVTDANRLATGADLVTKRLMEQGVPPNALDVEKLKPWATELVGCITKAINDGAIDGTVPNLAKDCLDTMTISWPP